jgi:hypothetical protein
MIRILVGLLALLVVAGCAAQPATPSAIGSGQSQAQAPEDDRPPGREYRPGGDAFSRVWDAFYAGDHEPELDDPLIAAGKPMVPYICEAVSHPDMQLRRYAIGALGFIGDKRATPTLERILADTTQVDYVRADALQAIYLIDRERADRLARAALSATDSVGSTAEAILNRNPALTEPTIE